MARPRSNLKAQLDWARDTGAFEPPDFSMLDAPDVPVRGSLRALPAAPVREPSDKRAPEAAKPSSESPTRRIEPVLAREAGAPPTPPSLHSEPDSDLDDLEAVMVIPSSECEPPYYEAARQTGAPAAEEVVIPSSSPSASPLASPARLQSQAARSGNEPEHIASASYLSAAHQQPGPVPADSLVMTSSSPPESPNRSLPFRIEEAVAPEASSQGPEIGSLLSEKIAIQEQKIEALCRALAAHGVTADTARLDERLREVDRRIDRFGDDEIEPLPMPGLLPQAASQSSFTQGTPQGHALDGFDSESDDDFGIVVDSVGPAHPAPPRTDLADPHYVNLATSSDFEDSPYFNNHNNSNNSNSNNSNNFYRDSATHSNNTNGGDISSDIIMETAPPPPPTQASQSRPWTREMMHILRTKFGLPGFRPNQQEAVNETLAGNDLVVLMPTGGGKSLCYQLPALCTTGATSGTTIVISPLISLMQDQVYHLKNRNIKAEMINSKLSASERNAAFSRLNAGELQLVYISPEMLSASGAMQSALHNLYSQNRLARIVIDEAHCVSSWGHDFRPDYKELDNVKNQYPGTPILALTATANERVLLDIVGCLRPNPVVLKQSFNRRNLIYEVRPKSQQVVNEIAAICRQFAGKTGIVYCFSKRSCEETAEDLRSMGISAMHYHAGMDQETRAQTQQDWQDGVCSVVCATIAFGMGIDKPDVRFVVHQTVPRNIEGYYQETGRAGRDGRTSTCVLFYNYGDVQLVRRMIDSDTNLAPMDREHHKALLNRMLQYCENKTDCRRKQVLQYFNEEFEAKHCKYMCDNCQNMRGQVILNKDLTAEARLLLQMAESVQHRQVTVQQCLDVVLGKNTKKVRECGFDQLPTYGKLRSMGMTEIERLAHHLITIHGLEEYSVRAHSRYPQTYVRLGKSARDVLEGRTAVKLKTVSGPVPSAGPVDASTTSTSKRLAQHAAVSSGAANYGAANHGAKRARYSGSGYSSSTAKSSFGARARYGRASRGARGRQ